MLHWGASMLATSRAEHAHITSATVKNGNLPAVAGGLSRPGARAEAIGGGTLGTLGDFAHSTQLEATCLVAAVRATGIRAVVKADLHVEEVELRAGEVIGDERQEAAYRLDIYCQRHLKLTRISRELGR